MRTPKRTSAGAFAAMLLAATLALGLPTAASAANGPVCGLTANPYDSYRAARSTMNVGGACDKQKTKARYVISGSSYTYTAYSTAGLAGSKWIATSPQVPSGKQASGHGTNYKYYGNSTEWFSTWSTP